MKLLTEYVMQASNFHPIKLDEYLSTNVKNTKVLNEEYNFPKRPLFNELKDFLVRNGFGYGHDLEKEKIDIDADTWIREITKKKKSNDYCYRQLMDGSHSSPDMYWMRFCNHGNDTKEIPMLFCYVTTDESIADDLPIFSKKVKEQADADFVAFNLTAYKEIHTWEEFEKIFIKTFNI